MSTHLSRLQQEHAPTLTQAEALAAGRVARGTTPRSSLGVYEQSDRDPLAILAEQNASRVSSLVPLRMGRMLQSPFAFYRGTAGIMAADLARGASTDIRVVACGDAHISNFGLFASPQRSMVFDLNDFDEAAQAPWDWDVKRLAASVVIGARESGFDEDDCREATRHAVAAYRTSLRSMMELTVLQRYYSRIDTDVATPGLSTSAQKLLDRATRQARKRTSEAFVEKISTRAADGTRLIIENPPVLTHVPEADESQLEELFERYRRTVPADIAHLLSQFTLTDVAMRVVGVGSVGTRCYILILTGPKQESLVLQVKEAQQSVLQSYGGIVDDEGDQAHSSEGLRVVANQRILQAVSDSFLGYLDFDGRSYYVRQFRDMKGSIDVNRLNLKSFIAYVDGCGILLARGHAQSPNAAVIAGYLGNSDVVDRAIVDWSVAYADQSLSDYARLKAAAEDGSIEIITGV
jgi:uncharacterized protein (DUF2252 family)